jgi:hypothetical protein
MSAHHTTLHQRCGWLDTVWQKQKHRTSRHRQAKATKARLGRSRAGRRDR